jgi:hypothetical protein
MYRVDGSHGVEVGLHIYAPGDEVPDAVVNEKDPNHVALIESGQLTKVEKGAARAKPVQVPEPNDAGETGKEE